jgi:hypothetical protein
MSNKKYTKEKLEPIVKQCKSARAVLLRLGLQCTGGNYSHFYKVCKREEIDISHFNGQGWSKGQTFPPKRPIEVYLSNERYISSHSLRKRLLKEGFFEYKCCHCGLAKWLDKPIPLELHHKDNNHHNNNLSNLSVVCPNCHAYLHNLARDCHTSDDTKPRQRKSSLKPHKRKVMRPDYQTLQNDIVKLGYCATGRKYGVSDNAVRKWVRMYQKHG